MISFNHVAVFVSDLEKSGRFYEQILELKKIEEPFKLGKHIWFHIGDHCQLHLIADKPKKDNVHWHFSFSVPDVAAFARKLEAVDIGYGDLGDTSKNNICFRPDGIKQIFFQDPDGYWIEANDDRY